MNRTRTARSKIEFTQAELAMMQSIVCIAEAQMGNWGDGDYIEECFSAGDAEVVFNSLSWKVTELLRRSAKPVQP